MGIKTTIEYVDSTINPVMGCTGCELLKDHCYARRLCARYAGLKGWPKDFTRPEHFPGRLEKALRWKDLTGTKRPDKPWLDGIPRVIFVNDLSDGWCPGGVRAREWLFPFLNQMARSPHIWLLLTKWPNQMRRRFAGYIIPDNVWAGTTLLRQDDTWRLDELLQIQGGKKWVSAEPLLGGIALDLMSSSSYKLLSRFYGPDGFDKTGSQSEREQKKPDFIVAGGETGPGARPTHPDNFRSLRDQCSAAQVPYFHKSNGEWAEPGSEINADVNITNLQQYTFDDGTWTVRVGKDVSGHLLNGQAWRQMPNVSPRNK